MNTRNKMLSIILSSIFIILIVAISQAFVRSTLMNNNPQNASLAAGDISLVYTDCVESGDCQNISENLDIGDSLEKTFKIYNNNTLKGLTYSIYFTNLTNTFVNNELVYRLINLDTGTVVKEETTLPSTTSEALMKNNIYIPIGSTHNYKLIITYKDLQENSPSNISATFSFRLSIKATLPTGLVADAADVSYTPELSNNNCTDGQCAVDELFEAFNNYTPSN